MYVCTHVRTYVLVTLRTVNLQYRLGMSIWGHARNVNLRSRLGPGTQASLGMCITQRHRDDISCQRRMGRTVWLALRNIRILRSQESAERSQRLATLRRKKQRSQSTVEPKRATEEQEFKSSLKARIGDASQTRYLGSLFTLPLFCTVLWAPTKRATPDTCAMCIYTGAWHGTRHHTHA